MCRFRRVITAPLALSVSLALMGSGVPPTFDDGGGTSSVVEPVETTIDETDPGEGVETSPGGSATGTSTEEEVVEPVETTDDDETDPVVEPVETTDDETTDDDTTDGVSTTSGISASLSASLELDDDDEEEEELEEDPELIEGTVWVLPPGTPSGPSAVGNVFSGGVFVVNGDGATKVPDQVLNEAPQGSQVQLELDDDGEVIDYEVLSVPTAPSILSRALSRTFGTNRVVDLILAFPDEYAELEADKVAAMATITDTSGFWSDQSAGIVSLATSVSVAELKLPCDEILADNPFDLWVKAADLADSWTVTSNTLSPYNSFDPVGSAAHLVVMVPEGAGCSWGVDSETGKELAGPAGVGTLGKTLEDGGLTLMYSGVDRVDITAHEIGHNLSLQHAAILDCGGTLDSPINQPLADGCELLEYWDVHDVMGYGGVGGPGSLSAPQAERLGFTRAQDSADLSDKTTHTLSAVASLDGTSAVRVQGGGEAYWVELRAPFGYDANLMFWGDLGFDAPFDGIQNVVPRGDKLYSIYGFGDMLLGPGVRVLKESSNNSQAHATGLLLHAGGSCPDGHRCNTLVANDEFTDWAETFTLTVDEIDGTSATITITPTGWEPGSDPDPDPDPEPESQPTPPIPTLGVVGGLKPVPGAPLSASVTPDFGCASREAYEFHWSGAVAGSPHVGATATVAADALPGETVTVAIYCPGNDGYLPAEGPGAPALTIEAASITLDLRILDAETGVGYSFDHDSSEFNPVLAGTDVKVEFSALDQDGIEATDIDIDRISWATMEMCGSHEPVPPLGCPAPGRPRGCPPPGW